MNNEDRILDLLRAQPGLTDREIRERTGIAPHQQVNQITNRLARLGKIHRVHQGGRYRNFAREHDDVPPPDTAPAATAASAQASTSGPLRPSVEPAEQWRVPTLTDGTVLLLLPCSKTKQPGGTVLVGPSILDYLPRQLAAELTDCRAANAPRARIDSDALMPASRRYAGRLYQAAGDTLENLSETGVRIAIISGGYGLVLTDEPIAWYDAEYRPTNWPSRLVPRCLAAATMALGVDRVVALAGTSTPYARAFRQTRWPVTTVLITPKTGSGAQQQTPHAIGEAIGALTQNDIDSTWTSSRHVPVRIEQLA